MISGLEGRINITLIRENERIIGVKIHSTRPQLAQRLLANSTPDQAVELEGLMFSLCGKAQRAAAQAACEAALGVTPDEALRQARERTVLVELTLEHAWRLFLDWPTQVGGAHTADMETLRALRQHAAVAQGFAETLTSVLEEVLGEPPQTWLAQDYSGFVRWVAAGKTRLARLFADLPDGADIGSSQVSLLPPLQRMEANFLDEMAHTALMTPGFCMQPVINGHAAETGAVSRVQHHPVLAKWIAGKGRGAGARMLARLLELAQMPAVLQGEIKPMVRVHSAGENVGVAAVETSRGILTHVVRLADGKIADYRIVAPTEWNFHPAGTLAQSLAGLVADASIHTRAMLVCQSLDPCVGYGVEVNHA